MGDVPLQDNDDVCCFFVTKHSWKGKYKRVYSVGTKGISTYNPGSFENTNQWAYGDILSIAPAVKGQAGVDFVLTVRKGKKADTLKFSSDQRTDLLTECLRFRHVFIEAPRVRPRYNAFKHHWSDNRVAITLEVGHSGLFQLDVSSGAVLTSYDYKDIEGIALVSDYPGGFCVFGGGFERLHLFASESRDLIIRDIIEVAGGFVGLHLAVRKDPLTFDRFISERFGKYSSDEALTSLSEFVVQKTTHRASAGTTRRILCLSESCLLERDPATYAICTVKPLVDVFCIVRHAQDPQLFSVEFVKGQTRTYSSTDRDSVLATVVDGVRAAGNRDIHVKMSPTKRGYRMGPFTLPVDEEVESQHLKFLQISPGGMLFSEVVQRFNSNISYSGLLHAVTQDRLFSENKEKLINAALVSLLEREIGPELATVEEIEALFQALRRLVASKAGFAAFTSIPGLREKIGIRVVKALTRNSDAVTYAVLDMLGALMQPMHDDYDLRQEQLNKASLMTSKKFLEGVLDVFTSHVQRGSGALIISGTLDFLTFALCAPYSETTDGALFDQLLELVAARGRSIFRLFQHPSMAIVKGAGLVMKALIEEGEDDVASRMQEMALAEGALPKHLHIALFTQSQDARILTNRQLSRILVSLWVTGNNIAMELLERVFPNGLLQFLLSSEEVPEHEIDRIHNRDNLQLAVDMHARSRAGTIQWKTIEKRMNQVLQHWRSRVGIEQKEDRSQQIVVLRKRRQKIRSEANWNLFFFRFAQDHALPNLIWNHRTREELRECLEAEIRAFNVDRDLGAGTIISWNYNEFEVPYNCLAEEIKIGDYYLRLLLEKGENDDADNPMKKPQEFFFDLYHRFLLSQKAAMKSNCLQAMTIVYARCFEQIGPFNDTKYMTIMLDKCVDKLERDRLVVFISKLLLNKQNTKDFLDANGLRVLVELLTLAHLHINRAYTPAQSNVIEANPEMRRDTEKEWYYGNVDKERLGPFSLKEMKDLWESGTVNPKTRCWSQGMDGWRTLQTVSQLKWTLMPTGAPVMNESELASLILSMLIKVCEFYPSRDNDDAVIRPLPKAKRILSDPSCLPHVVQLLLTFDSTLVEKVASLLHLVMQDNPQLSRLYLTGSFFFTMMYTGSNVLPIGRFLHYTHTKQAFRNEDEKTTSMLQRSILTPLLPEAMICYLENHGPDKFAEIFLGEFDSPEAIWNAEMRRLMIEKIATHIADFTPRLQSNTRALYQYCPIPTISYPQLENELFCNIYYLRHLCDVQRFPNWPIQEPVQLLKDVLEAWKKETEKKPPSMSVEDAYAVLGVGKKDGQPVDENVIRRAYFALAQKYHPDKNPEGRDIFEKVNKAYDFLCSRTGKVSDGPDPENLLLILKTQIILFSRYREELHPYKYAGYPMLIQTVVMETKDDRLFAKPVPLLAAACELVYHTVACSPLNVEELRRESGFEILEEALGRCVAQLNSSSQPDDLGVQVCMNIARCFAISSQFEQSCAKLAEMPEVIRDLCRLLYYSHLARLCCVAVECVSAFCSDLVLQTHLFKAGVLWHLLLFLFQYDYTLEEGNVERDADSNQQEVANNLAKYSIVACARLGGYLRSEKSSTPENPSIRQAISTLLTPYITSQFEKISPHELLKMLNSNVRNPYLLWNNGTRAQLTEYLDFQRNSMIRSGECDPTFGNGYVHEAHSTELIIGDVFVRIYNEQPTFPIENPKLFTVELLGFLGSQAQYIHSLISMSQADVTVDKRKTASVEEALEALRNVIRASPSVEIQCIGHFRLLFSLLRFDGAAKLQQSALDVVSVVVSNKDCVNDIAGAEVMQNLLLLIESLPSARLVILEVLHPLAYNSKIVKELMSKGVTIYLLDLFCNSTNAQIREKTAELLSKLMSEKLNGPKLRLQSVKFLPSIFMDAMRDSPETSVHMFEGTHENPELIWNEEAREKVASTVKSLKDNFSATQKKDPSVLWNLPPDYDMIYTNIQGEVVVGGVFLRLFVANPGWVLRKPKDFFVEVMDRFVEMADTSHYSDEELDLVVTSLVVFLEAQPLMADQVPMFGYIPKLVSMLKSKQDKVVSSTIRVIHQLAKSSVCVNSLSSTDCISALKMATKRSRGMTAIACEALNSIYSEANDDLVLQALNCDLVPFLLSLLESPLEFVPNPSGTKAHVVKTLKSMARSLAHGDKVSAVLEKSKIWSDYKDQRHDLFITNSNTSGYLTAGTPGVAGYLTQGRTKTMPDLPPPMDVDHVHDNPNPL